MATNSDVIHDALNLLGVTDDFNLTAEYGALGLRAMNDMLTMWEANEVDVGYFEQDSLTDDNPVEPEFLLAVKYNLAVAMAPYFHAVVGPALSSFAQRSYANLLRKEMDSRLESVTTDNASLGEAFRYNYNILTGD